MSVITYHVAGRDEDAKRAKATQERLAEAQRTISRAMRQSETVNGPLSHLEWVAVLHALQETLLADAILFDTGDTPTE